MFIKLGRKGAMLGQVAKCSVAAINEEKGVLVLIKTA